ncbi:hypothetical protein [Roseateles sp.]|uniref:hypothetical protein n=1 Tax=Roseateles sp. TaxID=1971397 RepID=UPI002F41EC7E
MSPPISPRTDPSATTDAVYANLTSSSETSKQRSEGSDAESLAPYRDDAPSLNYIQIEFLSKSGGRRPGGVSDAAVKPDKTETIYSTVDHFSTSERQRSPELFDAQQRLTKQVQTLVQEFATSKKAGVINKLVGSKDNYGAGAAAKALASRLNADGFAEHADAYSKAARGLIGRDRPANESHQLTGKAASAATLQALTQLTPEQRTVLARHLRNATLVDTAISESEPVKCSLSSASAREAVIQTMRTFIAGGAAPGGTHPQRIS